MVGQRTGLRVPGRQLDQRLQLGQSYGQSTKANCQARHLTAVYPSIDTVHGAILTIWPSADPASQPDRRPSYGYSRQRCFCFRAVPVHSSFLHRLSPLVSTFFLSGWPRPQGPRRSGNAGSTTGPLHGETPRHSWRGRTSFRAVAALAPIHAVTALFAWPTHTVCGQDGLHCALCSRACIFPAGFQDFRPDGGRGIGRTSKPNRLPS